MSQVDVYPTPNLPQSSSQSSQSNNGSFAPVLTVLAVIFVLVIVSVVAGRICNRRYSKGDHSHSKGGGSKAGKGKKSKQKDGKFHHHHQQPGGGGGEVHDIEFGFDKRFASAKVASNNGGDHFDFKVPKMPRHGGGGGGGGGGDQHRVPAVRFGNDHHIEFRTGA